MGTYLRWADVQVWPVIDGRLHAAPKDSPAVRIQPAAFASRTLKVAGQTNRAKVRRIK